MKTDKPSAGSGKTRFTKQKAKGESWVGLREMANKTGKVTGQGWKPEEQK